MKWYTVIICLAFIALLCLIMTREDNICHLEDVPEEEIIAEAKDILFKLNKSRMFRELAIKDMTYWVHNEPEKTERALTLYWKILP